MTELQIQRTPELIGSEIRSLTVQAKKMTLWFGIEIGRRLVEAKELVGHGEWLKYLSEQTEFSQSSANRFMTLFKEYGSTQESLFGAESNYPTLNNLSISNALKLLALPENEREEFAEEHDVEHLSTRELEKLLAEKEAAEEGSALRIAELEGRIDAANEAAQKAENERAEATAELKKAQTELKELRERPIETVVQIDEKAVERAKKRPPPNIAASSKMPRKSLKRPRRRSASSRISSRRRRTMPHRRSPPPKSSARRLWPSLTSLKRLRSLQTPMLQCLTRCCIRCRRISTSFAEAC